MSTELTTELDTTKYKKSVLWRRWLTNIGRAARFCLSFWNISSHDSFYSNCCAPFNNVYKGLAFSASFGRNLERVASLLFSLCTSFNELGLVILRIASHLSGLASIPLYVTMNPKNLPAMTPKKHFWGFNSILWALILSKTLVRAEGWSSPLCDFTTISSTYTSMVLSIRSLKTLSIIRW